MMDIKLMQTKQFKEYLEEKYELRENDKKEKLFDIAWEFGHHAGHNLVESYYVDMIDLIE